MSSIIRLISVENNIPLLCLGIHVGLPFFFFCQPHLLHLLSSMCSSTEPEDPPCRILKGRPYSIVVHSPVWILPGHVNFIPLILSANIFPFTFIFPKLPQSSVLSHTCCCPASSILLVYSLSYLKASFQYFSGDFREMRSENLLGMQSCARNL